MTDPKPTIYVQHIDGSFTVAAEYAGEIQPTIYIKHPDNSFTPA